MGILSTSYEIGNVVALNVSGLVARWGWRALFLVNPLLFAVIGGSAVVALGAGEGAATTPGAPTAAAPVVDRRAAMRAIFSQGAFWVTVALSALLTFMRVAFLTWTPTYLYEVSRASGHTELTGSIVKSSLFPAAGAIAAVTVGALSDRLGPGRRAPLMAGSMMVVVVLVLVLGHGGITSATGAAVLIGGVGLFLLGPYSLLAGAVALDVSAAGGTATAAGFIDGAGYLGGTAAGYVLGRLADTAGWSAVFDLVTGTALTAATLCAGWSVVVMRARR
jgi:sugar phosphate permease